MKWSDVYVNGLGMWLGQREEVRDAVAGGRYDLAESIADDLVSIRVAGRHDVPVDMAVAAARSALDRSDVAAGQVELILHASFGHQGLDHFAPASYIQNRAVGGRAAALEVRQASNGGMAALHLAAAYLTAAPGEAAALVTTADKFSLPGWDRFRHEQGMILSDGATALVLSRRPGVARLLSSVMIGDATHEQIYRGDSPWTLAPGEAGWPVDLRTRSKQYLAQGVDPAELRQSIGAHLRESLLAALRDAEVGIDSVARFVFAGLGRGLQNWPARKAMGIDESRTTWPWSRTVGHIGAGDQIAGLTYLLETGQVRAGDKVVLSGAGRGWCFSAAVVEILSQPRWPCDPSHR